MSKRRQLPDNEIFLYQNESGNVNVEVLFDNDNLWLLLPESKEIAF